MKKLLSALLFASVTLAGCGSVTQGLNFKAPAGWAASPSILGRMQMWFKKTGDDKTTEMVFLIRGQSANTMNLKDIPNVGSANIREQKQSTITICGNTKAQYITASAQDKNGANEHFEMIEAPVGDESYVAMYIRPENRPASPEAESAIRSLCKSSLS